jgi:hypothetical protein
MGRHVRASRQPVQVSGAPAPVSARPGRQACRRRHAPCCVGREGAQAPRAVALRPAGARWTVPHDARGVVPLVERWPPIHPHRDGVGRHRPAWRGASRRRWPRRGGPAAWGIHGRRARGRGPRGRWPRPRRPAPWPMVPPRGVRRPARCRTPRRRRGAPCADVAHHAWACGPPRRTGWRGRAGASTRTWRRLSPDATGAWPGGPTPARSGCGRARGGGTTTPAARAPPALAPWGRARYGGPSPRWGRARASTGRRGWAWPPSMATVGPSGGGASSGEAAHPGAPCSPWGPAGPRVTTRGCKPLTHGAWRRGRSPQWP